MEYFIFKPELSDTSCARAPPGHGVVHVTPRPHLGA
jgi:hypothetical protein